MQPISPSTAPKALLTGVSRGIGRAIALHLAAEGYQLLLLARSKAELQTLVQEIEAKGSKAWAYPTDLSQTSELQAILVQIKAEHPRIDVLINNAGVGTFSPIADFNLNDWQQMWAVNVDAVFQLSQALIPCLQRSPRGQIITIASDAARRSFANGTAYCATKYAIDGMMAALRKEVRPLGIKVSVLFPGLVDTYFNQSTPGSPEKQEHLKPEDLAQAVGFILRAAPHVVVDELVLHPFSQDY